MASDKPSTIPPRSSRAESPRLPHLRSPAPRLVVGSTRRTRRARAEPPTVTRSFVVEVRASDETNGEVTACIRPTERAATAAIENGFRFSGGFLDVVSDLLVEIVREEDEKK